MLTDFGLALEFGQPSLTQAGGLTGTPSYVSPEQLQGRRDRVDARSDVFSLGTTLYELLTQRRPFDGATTQQVLQRIATADAPNPQTINHDLPSDLTAVVLKALEKAPDRRYQSAGDLAADLRAFLAHRPVAARRVTTARKLRRWVTREPAKALLAAVLIIAIPTMSTLLGVVIARAPLAEEGEKARQADQVEQMLARGFRELVDKSGLAGGTFESLLRLAPGHVEATAGRALALIERERWSEAEELLDAGEVAPRFGRMARVLRVHLHRSRFEEREAKALEQQLGELEGHIEHFIVGVSEALLAVRVRVRDAAAQRSHDERAQSLLNRAVLMCPTVREAYHYQRALVVAVAGSPQAARDAAAALCELWPESSAAWYAAGVCFTSLHTPNGRAASLAAHRRATRLDPSFATAWYALGWSLTETGDWPAAVNAFRRALELAPHSPDTLGGLGWALTNAGEHDEAIDVLTTAIAARPDHVKAMQWLGLAKGQVGDLVGAVQAYRQSLEVNPRQHGAATVHRNLMVCLNRLGDVASARSQHQFWVRHFPDDVTAWRLIATILLQAKGPEREPAAALAAARRAVELTEGRDPHVLHLLGQCHSACGQPAEAAAAARRALALVPDGETGSAPLREAIMTAGRRYRRAAGK